MDDGTTTVAEVYSVEDGSLQLGMDRRAAMGTVLTIAAALVGISGSADASTKKKSCKKGYKWDSKKGKCVKKKSSSSDKNKKKSSSGGSSSICTCNKVCTCVPVYY
jgi:hypothetical protein